MAKIEWGGLDEIEENLLKLRECLASDLRSAANAGASVVKEEVAARAPRDQGVLASEIYQKHIPEHSDETLQTYYVSWRKGGKQKNKDAYYGFWVEYGHWFVPHKVAGVTWKAHRAATKTVFVPARPFLRPGFEAKRQEAVEIMRNKLGENIRRRIAELNK